MSFRLPSQPSKRLLRYQAAGFAPASACACPGTQGLGDVWDDISKGASSLTAPLTAKVKKLESALTLITILAGVSAAAAVYTVVTRK